MWFQDLEGIWILHIVPIINSISSNNQNDIYKSTNIVTLVQIPWVHMLSGTIGDTVFEFDMCILSYCTNDVNNKNN